MRKYVLTDRAGVTVTGHTLAPGKFIQAKNDKANLMARINACGAETPLLAALLSPIATDQARLFSIHCWNVTIDPKNAQSYTVVKEIETVPAVTPAQRLRFAVLLAKETCRDRDFRHWADLWLNGTDTGVQPARDLLARLQSELHASANLEEIGAWVESGADTELAQRQDAGAQRACHVLRAVVLLDDPERVTSAAMEITQALAGLEQLAAQLPLTTMGELAMGEPPLQQATG
jgi:hypothetical protein